ncbi:GyrI-like domain-containing protein [Zavarzinella formosa]|uniref:GyrI-like domain-containing protein n=1 Tax=Zavarzinella formosa TaxID=360055 RepID=UPI0036F2D618
MGLETPRFENGRAFQIAGLSGHYTQDTRKQIPDLWCKFIPHVGKIPGQVSGETYGVCWNFQPECTFDYLAGVEIPAGGQLPTGFTQVQIPAGRYVVIPFSGHVSKITELFDTIWTKWLPESGLKTADTPVFERYTEKFNTTTLSDGIEIWIPLQA